MLAHATPPHAKNLLTRPVCAIGTHLAGDSYICKRDSHYSSGHVLPLKCAK
jgi:hypothetical protein